jgi:AcrR family transcriptional regulator
MESRSRRPGVSKAEWLEAALETVAEAGITGLTVQGLARTLGIAKAGFYWHFRDRDDLLRQLLDYWSHELTEVVANNPMVLALEPKARLRRISEMILEYDLSRYEVPMRQWARQDKMAARVVRRVNRTRLDLVSQAFAELGFTGDELEMRALLFLGYLSAEGPMFPELSRKRRRELIEGRIDLLTRR